MHGTAPEHRYVQQMLSEIHRSIDIGGQEVTVKASIGISTYPLDGDGSDAILHAADCAMYAAKNAGKNRHSRYRELQEVQA